MIAETKKIKQLPKRSQVKEADTWDLASLFASDAAWEKAFGEWEKRIAGYDKFRGKLADDAKTLAACLRFDTDFDQDGERLGTYAFLKTAEDAANSDYQRMIGRYRNVASRAGQAASYIRPEIMAIPAKSMDTFMAAKPLAEFRLLLDQIVRYRPHTLGKKEEKLLAMQSEMADASNLIFRQLTDADLKWGSVKNEKGELVELSNSTFSSFLNSPDRAVRKKAFHEYYRQFTAHENTLAATLAGSMQRDVYYARARNYPSALEASLFLDKVPVSVVDNLVASVHKHLPSLYEYYDLRRRKMNLREIHHYDTYVPILSELKSRHTWQQAVKLVIGAIEPLGNEYCGALEQGLHGRWSDRYPNQGKQSGAFSSGSYGADPYILMNYQPDVLDHVFTLAHEAGHSMHTWFSARNQPYQYYNYTIFVAEVASTFNEQLLSRYLMERAKSDKERAFLINREIDSIRGTIIRQTMFAEFEQITHALVESGEPLTVEKFKSVYNDLLKRYFGPDFTLDEELSLECFRIPHFYRAFYVYKYATGLSAAIALSQRVVNGGQRELSDYLGFLKGGCSKYPLELLQGAGVDMSQPQAVDTALAYFGKLVKELDELLQNPSSNSQRSLLPLRAREGLSGARTVTHQPRHGNQRPHRNPAGPRCLGNRPIAGGLSAEQWQRKFEMGPGSLEATLTHILAAKRAWGDMLAQREPRPRLDAGAPPAIEELMRLNEEISADFAATARAHPHGEIVSGQRGGREYQVARGGVIAHVTTHGMHHRAQCLNMLRQLGISPMPQSSVLEWMLTVDR